MWQTRVSYVDSAYITLVNTELWFRLFKLGISNFWFRVSNTRIAPLVGFCGALPNFDSIRRCAPLIRFCGASEFGGAILIETATLINQLTNIVSIMKFTSLTATIVELSIRPQNPTRGAILVSETLNQKFEIPNLNNLNPNSVFTKVM